MAEICFPEELETLLKDSRLQSTIRGLADRVGEIVGANDLWFFPDYTDHGADHINEVLRCEVSLVPAAIWSQSRPSSNPRPLWDIDAAVTIGATLLHDIAMHLHQKGFLELVAKDTRFEPLPWFHRDQDGHAADRPWYELWQDYVREARRFSEQILGNIIGLESMRQGWKFHDLPKDMGQWERNHCLIVGEFIRRHHARIAHEIAIYGFPGLPVGSDEGSFPAMGGKGYPLTQLADLIGLTARSHGTSLRVCKAYLDSVPQYQGTPRPMNTAVLFPMALLRVADYLQIDRQRAPVVLLQLKNPQSPVSVQEWRKHLAVQSIVPATDPRGKMVTISKDLSLELYLQLSELLAGLQAEMDHSTAVLDEVYGTRSDLGLDQLGLATRRVHSNLRSPTFRDSLPFVPQRTGFSADPNLLTLLIEPLYGKHPSVGVRELIQNSVDAVRELHAWCDARGKDVDSLDLPLQECDVLIEFVCRKDGTWLLRARDKGIGMEHETIQNYFLRAGASFRQSPEWTKEFLDDEDKPHVLRAGRFGIGAFAIFLLGPTFRVWTRHVGALKTAGYTLEASADSRLIEIRRAKGLPIGTTIEVDLTGEAVEYLALDKLDVYRKGDANPLSLADKTDWFCWDWPKVIRRVVGAAKSGDFAQEFTAPLGRTAPPPEWSVIHPKDFEAVFWTFAEAPILTCNGLRIHDAIRGVDANFTWPEGIPLERPRVAVFDSAANLPLTMQRYTLSRGQLPFIQDLVRDVMLSFIAHALVCGPTGHNSTYSSDASRMRHPLTPKALAHAERDSFSEALLCWCSTCDKMVPADPWLYSLLHADTCLVLGHLGTREIENYGFPDRVICGDPASKQAVLRWDVDLGHLDNNDPTQVAVRSADLLYELARSGVAALGHSAIGAWVVMSLCQGLEFEEWVYHYVNHGTKDGWQEASSPNAMRQHFELQMGTITPSLSSKELIAEMKDSREGRWPGSRCLYVAEIRANASNREPESLIATIWNECLGPQAIPFEPAARKALIDHGRRHRELKHHIEAWEEMKRTGSKYVAKDLWD